MENKQIKRSQIAPYPTLWPESTSKFEQLDSQRMTNNLNTGE